jgi:hypothetical protein
MRLVVGAGQHEQPGGDKVVAGVDPHRPPTRHDPGRLSARAGNQECPTNALA